MRFIFLTALFFVFFSYSQASFAEGFTGEKFLKWKRESQDSFIGTSITMVAVVATQGRQNIASCIDDWYSEDGSIQDQRHGFILDTIREYPSYHPQGIILAVLQKRCGSFKDKAD